MLIGILLIWAMLFVDGGEWFWRNSHFLVGYSILMLLCCIFVFIHPVRLILDITRLRATLRELKKCGGTLPRPRLEQMLSGIRGKRSRARLVTRLSRMNIQLIGDWTHVSRPVIGMEREDQLLTSLDTKDLPLTR